MRRVDIKKEKDPEFLRAAAAALEEENRALRAERAALEAALVEARAARDTLERQHTEEVAALQAELASVREKLTLREQQLYGQKSERRPSKEKTGGNEAKQKEKPARAPRKGHGPTDQPDLERYILALPRRDRLRVHPRPTPS
jgi:chromosome segregation ATPase